MLRVLGTLFIGCIWTIVSPAAAIAWQAQEEAKAQVVSDIAKAWSDLSLKHSGPVAISMTLDMASGGGFELPRQLLGVLEFARAAEGRVVRVSAETPPRKPEVTEELFLNSGDKTFQFERKGRLAPWLKVDVDNGRLDRYWEVNIEHWHPLRLGNLDLQSVLDPSRYRIEKLDETEEGRLHLIFSAVDPLPDSKQPLSGEIELDKKQYYVPVRARLTYKTLSSSGVGPREYSVTYRSQYRFEQDLPVRKWIESEAMLDGTLHVIRAGILQLKFDAKAERFSPGYYGAAER